MSIDLEHLVALEQAARALPWRVDGPFGISYSVRQSEVDTRAGIISGGLRLEDAALIVAMRNALPELLIDLRSLTRWKSEAMQVGDGLQELGKVLDLRLGERITGSAALNAASGLLQRAEAAEARVAPTRTVRDEPADERRVH